MKISKVYSFLALLALSIVTSAQANIITSSDSSLLFRYDTDVNSRDGFAPSTNNLIGTVNAFDLRQSTVSFWLKLNSVQSGWNSILHIGNANDQRYPGFWMYPGTDRLHYRIGSNGSWNTGVDPSTAVVLDEWLKVSTVWDGGNGSVYFNDTLVASTSLNLSWSASATGSWNVFAGDPWYSAVDGVLDDIRIYNRALTLDELQSNDLFTAVDEPASALFVLLGGLLLVARRARK